LELWIGGGRTGERQSVEKKVDNRQFGGPLVPAREKERTFRYALGLADEGEEVLAGEGRLRARRR
jgi:hypothetical protein